MDVRRCRERRWKAWLATSIATAVAVGSIAGCSKTVYHRVRPGETVYRIGKAYGVSVKEIAAANRLADPSRIIAGQRLVIPRARRALPVSVITPRQTASRRSHGGAVQRGVLQWPVSSGNVTSGFGKRNRSFHDGIDISAPAGTPVYAAADGEVIYADVLRGYGNVIIVRHARGLATVYAHNQRNRVREGQRVRRGELIGHVGDSGRTTGPNLHFEVRQDNVARDPLLYLPTVEFAAPKRGAAGGG